MASVSLCHRLVSPPNATHQMTCRKVLLEIKQSLNKPIQLASWKPNTDCCDWNDVICDSTTKQITTLQFGWGNISGQFPAIVNDIPSYMAPSLNTRQDMVVVEIPKLGKEAAAKAIKEWGQPKSKITYLVFCTTSGVDMHGADYQLTKLLGLHPFVKRLMMYQQGYFVGGTVFRLTKDLSENNAGARVLVVCSEITAVTFRGPSNTHLDSLIGQALFGDGDVAMIVRADPDVSVKRPLF